MMLLPPSILRRGRSQCGRSCRTRIAYCFLATSFASAFRWGGEDALLVPDVALGSDQGGRYVLIVNQDNVVEQRKVEIGALVDGMRVIAKGITASDRVVVSGILRAIPGNKVDPQTAPTAQGGGAAP